MISHSSNLIPVIIFVFTCIGFLVANFYHSQKVIYPRSSVDHWRIQIGQALNDSTDESTTIALIPAGIIKYYSERYAIDMLGLNDRDIAHTDMQSIRGLPGHEKYNIDSVLAREPDIIITQHPPEVTDFKELAEWVKNDTATWYSHALLSNLVNHPELEKMYEISQINSICGVLTHK